MIDRLLAEQRKEMSSYLIYKRLSEKNKNPQNKKILKNISDNELEHYNTLKKLTQKDTPPRRLFMIFFYIVARLFGLTFGIKLLERGETDAAEKYGLLKDDYPQVADIVKDEEVHEKKLIDMIDEEKLNYVGSIVLGLNDALVELTGALAGFTFAFQNTHLIAVTGLITGISASFSMAASEYLSTVHETGDRKGSLKSAMYTGIAYVFTVVALILPYLIFANPFLSLGVCLSAAVLIILVFNFYVSVAKDTPFKRRFWEMVLISLGVSGISFLIGILVKNLFNIDIG
jgi:VIT1/CCC1 family predicted Fe2+/Mn2+ transporter